LVEKVLDQVLSMQVTEALGAKPFERTDTRQGYRNGVRERVMNTRVGRITLSVSQVRQGGFSTDLFERYQLTQSASVRIVN
jgi:transposase-like protein